MAGPNSSVNNALAVTRGGGHVVLFGLKDGDFIVPHFNRAIVKGLTLHGVIGRKIFGTWQTSQRMLSDKQNGIQEKIWRVIMKRGNGTILQFSDYTPEKFEEMMGRHPKILIRM
jgi:threonine 3-dehydrogenase